MPTSVRHLELDTVDDARRSEITLTVFSSTLGREITYEPVDFGQFAELMRAGGLSELNATDRP